MRLAASGISLRRADLGISQFLWADSLLFLLSGQDMFLRRCHRYGLTWAAEQTLRALISLARYAEAFVYDDDTGKFLLADAG